MKTPIWYLVTEEIQRKLQVLLPENWTPPGYNKQKIVLESLEEIDRIMRQPPGPEWRATE